MFKTGILLGLLFSFTAQAAPTTLKWVLAHEPSRVFERAAKTFGEKLSQKTNGELTIEVVKSGELSSSDVFNRVKNGELQMSQTYTTYLGNHDKALWVLDLPFLFRSHDHASKVLDGPIGVRLLADLEKSGVKGLAFTYSGGYRIISTTHKPLNKLQDFKGQEIRVINDSPVAAAYMKSLGAIPIVTDSSKGGVETTYARLETIKDASAKYLNETEHSLFLTSIIINKKVYDSLPAKHQKALREVAIETARIEREDSIKDGFQSREKFIKDGMTLVKMSSEEQNKLKQKSQKIYSQFHGLFGKGLIAEIQNQ